MSLRAFKSSDGNRFCNILGDRPLLYELSNWFGFRRTVIVSISDRFCCHHPAFLGKNLLFLSSAGDYHDREDYGNVMALDFSRSRSKQSQAFLFAFRSSKIFSKNIGLNKNTDVESSSNWRWDQSEVVEPITRGKQQLVIEIADSTISTSFADRTSSQIYAE